MLLFVASDLAADVHTLGQQFHQLVIQLVNLLTQLLDVLSGDVFIADDEQREDVVKHLRCHLLLGIAPCLVGIAVALDDESVEAQVHSLLAQGSYQFTLATNVRGVADDGKIRNATMQLDGNLPHGGIAINFLLKTREATMDGSQTLDASLVQTLHGTNPQFQVRVDRVLDEDWDVDSPQRVSQSLHGKGVCSGSGTYPQNIHVVLQCQLHVLRSSHLSGYQHVGFILHLLHPGQGLLAITLESAWLGTWFPYTGTEVVATLHGQLAGCCHHLLLCLGTAGTCNDEGAFVVTRQIQWL